MAKLAIIGHNTRGNEVIKILEMLGGENLYNKSCSNDSLFCYISDENRICELPISESYRDFVLFTLEEFIEKHPYEVEDEVFITKRNKKAIIDKVVWCHDTVTYWLKYDGFIEGNWTADHLQSYKEETMEEQKQIPPYMDYDVRTEETMEDKGNISDGYHTFNELYEYRLLYNASMFNELAKQGLYDVHKSRKHSDGTIPFGDENWFIVQAELPTGQISNHYEMKDWDLFNVPEKEKANTYDGHTPQDVAKRLRGFLTTKSKYSKNKVRLNNFILWCKGWYRPINEGEYIFKTIKNVLKLDGYELVKSKWDCMDIIVIFLEDFIRENPNFTKMRMYSLHKEMSKYMNTYKYSYEESLLMVIRDFFAFSVTSKHIELTPPVYSRKLHKMGLAAPDIIKGTYKQENKEVDKFFKK